MVVVDLQGKKVEGKLNPSSDTPTHMELYNRFPGVGGIVHTHSRWATIWAQAGRAIPPYGTTHADYIYGPVPVTRSLTDAEVRRAYELETGKVIAEHFETEKLDTKAVPCVLVRNHGPFAWGKDAMEAVHNAVVLEEVAMMAWHTEALPMSQPRPELPAYVKEKHYMRKHGPDAYYGQK
jgi:L-ribulose-5-phosphate 4-epimerase